MLFWKKETKKWQKLFNYLFRVQGIPRAVETPHLWGRFLVSHCNYATLPEVWRSCSESNPLNTEITTSANIFLLKFDFLFIHVAKKHFLPAAEMKFIKINVWLQVTLHVHVYSLIAGHITCIFFDSWSHYMYILFYLETVFISIFEQDNVYQVYKILLSKTICWLCYKQFWFWQYIVSWLLLFHHSLILNRHNFLYLFFTFGLFDN